MKAPLIPFNFVIFPKCKHLIAFLADLDFDSIEFFEYKNSSNGSAREVILTFKNTEQLVLINSGNLAEKLNEAGRKAIYAEINFGREQLRTGAVLINISFKSEKYSGKVVFQSLFPTSDYHSGVVDPNGHAKNGIPCMYSRQNTFAIKCSVMINGELLKARVAKSDELTQFNSLQAYYSDEFTLVTFTLKKQMLECIMQDKNECIYKDSIRWNFKKQCDNEVIKYREYNYVDEVYHYILSKDGKLEEIQVELEGEIAVKTNFEPAIPLDDIAGQVNGKMMIHINCVEHVFECTYSVISSQGDTEKEILATYNCCYSNGSWKEGERGITCNTSKLYNNQKECIKFIVRS